MNLDFAIVCPYCHKIISKHKLRRHLDKRCERYWSQEVKCPECGALVRRSKLRKHLRKKHGIEI